MATVKVFPEEALVDDLISIKIEGLQANQNVTIHASLPGDGTDKFVSYAYYRASDQGVIDLSQQSSMGGSYSGIEPMGLFWAMKPSSKNERLHSRFVMRNVETPVEVSVTVYDSHFRDDEIEKQLVLASGVIKRWYKDKDVTRVPIREGRIRGTLFIPRGRGPHPAVVDLFGTAGGLMEFRASLLASHGFLTLSLAFFDFEDLPKTAFDIDLEYFEEAKDFLLSQPTAAKHGVGIVGVSVGGSLALAVATYVPGYICAVSINGPVFAQYASLTFKGRVWLSEGYNLNRAYVDQRSLILKHCLDDHWDKDLSDSLIEFHKCQKSFLFIFSEDDKAINAPETARLAKSLLQKGNSLYKIISYPGAGHLLEPPYSPHAAVTYTKLFNMAQGWGGNTKQHADAQERAWHETIKYLRDTLKGTPARL